MKIVLREYQENMIAAITAAIPDDQFILVQAATGAGKTIVFSKLCQRLLREWPQIRIAILAHRRELITQAETKLRSVWPKAPIGIACASVQSKKKTTRSVTIGSVQTLVGQVETTEPFDIIIIDEVHRLPPRTTDSQYKAWLDVMLQYNPKVRMIGFSATPFRLNHGFIYGKGCRPGSINWFDSLHYSIRISDLQKQGFLCGYRAKAAVDISDDLKSVKTSGGEYNIGDLSDMMSKQIHMESALKAYRDYGEDRRHVVIFAVTIDHAEKLKRLFQDSGYPTGIVHSEMTLQQRDMNLSMFESGALQFIVNVGVLTEGWDSTAIDCIIMCRPTKSAALFVQMTGRGLRIHEGKTDVLILDLANNCIEHGDPDKPNINIPGRESLKKEEKEQTKSCPKCHELVNPAVKMCPACGYKWPVEEKKEVNHALNMADVDFKPEQPKPFIFEITHYSVDEYISKAGNRMVKLSLESNTFLKKAFVNQFFMFDPDAHEYAQKRSRKTWFEITGSQPPSSTDEALDRSFELEASLPQFIEVVEDGKWLKIHSWKTQDNNPFPKELLFCKSCQKDVPFEILPGAGPHESQARCGSCNAFIKWFPKGAVNL